MVDDSRLPDTGVGRSRERELSPRFIHAAEYGTRSSTAILIGTEGDVRFQERRFDADGEVIGDEVHTFNS